VRLADAWAIGDITRSPWWACWLLAVAFDLCLVLGELCHVAAEDAGVGLVTADAGRPGTSSPASPSSSSAATWHSSPKTSSMSHAMASSQQAQPGERVMS
jgi:hypothetical protein